MLGFSNASQVCSIDRQVILDSLGKTLSGNMKCACSFCVIGRLWDVLYR